MSKLSSRRETFLGFQPPAVGDEEVAAVAEAIRSGWLTTGPRAADLEERFAHYAGAKHASQTGASARMRARVNFARIDAASGVNFVSLQDAV